MKEFNGVNIFLNIPAKVAYDQRLKPNAKLIYGEICSMLNVTNSFFMSNKALAERFGCSERMVINYLNSLEEYGYIERTNIYEGKQVVRREIMLGSEANFTRGSEPHITTPMKPTSGAPRSTVHEGTEQGFTDNRTINRATNRTVNRDILSGKPDHIPYKEILDYLNQKAGTRYRASSQKTKSLIRARIKDGFTVDDFKKVIDIKVNSWGSDPKMSQYLRPVTLFGTKFESYLNEPMVNERQMANPYDRYYE